MLVNKFFNTISFSFCKRKATNLELFFSKPNNINPQNLQMKKLQKISPELRLTVDKIINISQQIQKLKSLQQKAQYCLNLSRKILSQIRNEEKIIMRQIDKGKNKKNYSINYIIAHVLTSKCLSFGHYESQIFIAFCQVKCRVYLSSNTLKQVINYLVDKTLSKDEQNSKISLIKLIFIGKTYKIFNILKQNLHKIQMPDYKTIFELIITFMKFLSTDQKLEVIKFVEKLHKHILESIIAQNKQSQVNGKNYSDYITDPNIFPYYLMILEQIEGYEISPNAKILQQLAKKSDIKNGKMKNYQIQQKENKMNFLKYSNFILRNFPFNPSKTQLILYFQKKYPNSFGFHEIQLFFLTIIKHHFACLFKKLQQKIEGQFFIIQPQHFETPKLSQDTWKTYKNIQYSTYAHSQVQQIVSGLYPHYFLDSKVNQTQQKYMPQIKRRSKLLNKALLRICQEYNIKYSQNIYLYGIFIDFLMIQNKTAVIFEEDSHYILEKFELKEQCCFRNAILLCSGYKLLIIKKYQLNNNRQIQLFFDQLILQKLKILWEGKAIYIS